MNGPRDPFGRDPFDRDPFERIRRQKELEREYTKKDAERDNPNQPGYPRETDDAWRKAREDAADG